MLLNELFTTLTEGVHDPNTFKALFVLGAPGSGKTTVSRLLTQWTGLRSVTPDQFYEMFKKRRGVNQFSVGPDAESDPEWTRSRILVAARFEKLLNGRLGLVMDATGRYAPIIEYHIQKLRNLGYDVAILYVKTDVETAIKRQKTRDRQMDPSTVKQYHQDVENNMRLYSELVGDNFVVLDNSGNTAQAVVNNPENFHSTGSRKITADQWLRRWLRTPVNNPAAQNWKKSQGQRSV